MEDELSRFFKFKWGKSKLDVTLMVLLILSLIGGIGYLLHSVKNCWETGWEVFINLLASLLAFIFAFLIIWLISWVYKRHEDELKVSYKNSQMLKIYKNKDKDKKHDYRKQFKLHPEKEDEQPCIVYCDKLFFCNENTNGIKIIDKPNQYFEVNHFIELHAVKLLGAHSASKTTNEFTPRLQNFEKASDKNNNKPVLTIARSTYVNHLLTNRVLDYQIAEDVSLRRMYESIDVLTELPISKMSNHIGINALLFLVEGGKRYLVMPHRGKDATVVKDGVTASLATRLMVEGYEKATNKEEYIKETCVREEIKKKLPWTKDQKKETALTSLLDNMNICFLGLARDPYEGGKPTLFYTIDLETTCDKFASLMYPDYVPQDIDAIKDIMIVEWNNISLDVAEPSKVEKTTTRTDDNYTKLDQLEAERYDEAKLKLKNPRRIEKDKSKKSEDPICILKDIKDKSFIFEQNLIANFWFYTEQQEYIKEYIEQQKKAKQSNNDNQA